MQFFAALAAGVDQSGRRQHGQVLGHRLPAHFQAFAQFTEGLPGTLAQPVEQQPPVPVGQCLEHRVQVRAHIETIGNQ